MGGCLCCAQETIEKTDANGKLLPEMVRWLVGGPIERARGGVCELALTWRLKLNPGPLPPAQILICQNLRNNLQHPNEFIRGVTLRFLCRIHEEELLEPLVPSGARPAHPTPHPPADCLAG